MRVNKQALSHILDKQELVRAAAMPAVLCRACVFLLISCLMNLLYLCNFRIEFFVVCVYQEV